MEKNMNAFVIFNLNSNNYLHSTKEGGTDHITCAYMTAVWPEAIYVCKKANDEFSNRNWIIRPITITVHEQ